MLWELSKLLSCSSKLIAIVNINKQKPHIKWSQEAKGALTHVSLTHTTTSSGNVHLAPPAGNDSNSLLQQGRKDSSLPKTTQPMGDYHNSPNEKSLYLQCSLRSPALFLSNSPSHVHKRPSSPWFLWTCTRFTIRPRVLSCSSLLFPN